MSVESMDQENKVALFCKFCGIRGTVGTIEMEWPFIPLSCPGCGGGWKINNSARCRRAISESRAPQGSLPGSPAAGLDLFTRRECEECKNFDGGIGSLPCPHCSGGFIYTKVPASPSPVLAAFDFHAHLARQAAWSERTFGPGSRAKGVVDHIRKELAEIEADPGDLKEWIDVAILAFDGAWRSGALPSEIVAAMMTRQAKNEARKWPDWRTMDPNKAIEHDRSGESSAIASHPPAPAITAKETP